MKCEKRRQDLAIYLLGEKRAIPGHILGQRYGVSRQIIVGDIAAIREMGYVVASTHFGYVITKSPLKERVFKVWHDSDKTEEELKLMVELGGVVMDVYVMHKVYGKVAAKLNVYLPEHIEEFMKGVRTGKSTELMQITDGYHYHTVRAETEEILDQIQAKLQEKGFLINEK